MTRPAYDPAETYRFKATAFPFTAAATVDAEVKTIEGVDATDALEAAAAAAIAAAGLTGAGGTGARAITFTITDADTAVAIEGATVRLYRTGSLDRTGETDSSGVLTMLCDVDAVWNYTVTHPLYGGATGAIDVDGNESEPVGLTALSWPASTEVDTVTVRALVRGLTRVPIGAGKQVQMRIKTVPDDVNGIWHKGLDSDLTDANSYVYFANVPIGAVLLFTCGTNTEPQEKTVASDATTPYDVGPLYGVWA